MGTNHSKPTVSVLQSPVVLMWTAICGTQIMSNSFPLTYGTPQSHPLSIPSE